MKNESKRFEIPFSSLGGVCLISGIAQVQQVERQYKIFIYYVTKIILLYLFAKIGNE